MKTLAILLLASAPSVSLSPDQVMALKAHISQLEQEKYAAQADALGYYKQLEECKARKQF